MPSSGDNDLAKAFKDVAIYKPHSLKKEVPFSISTFHKDDKNMVEVELATDGYFSSGEAIQTVVSDDQNSLNVAVGTCKQFASTGRKARQLGANYHEQNVRKHAYDDTVQGIRKIDNQKLRGEYYYEDPQEIVLPFKCERTIVKKKLHHHPVAVHVVRGVQYHQFKTYYTILLEGVERRIGVEHEAHSATYEYTADELRPNDSDEM